MANKTKSCQGKDTLERMNFLYQAGTLMAGRSDTLSCYYGYLCKSVAKKAVLRMEPNIKRTICKRCAIIMKPGTTADMSIDGKCFQMTCLKCGSIKRFALSKTYSMWLDDPKSIKETMKFERGGTLVKQECVKTEPMVRAAITEEKMPSLVQGTTK